jgi:hypothetical protein
MGIFNKLTKQHNNRLLNCHMEVSALQEMNSEIFMLIMKGRNVP